MCGIVGYIGDKECTDILLDGLSKLEYRGYDSAGIAYPGIDGFHIVKAKGRLDALREKLAAQPTCRASCGIGHTRWATHGEPSEVNSHPHAAGRVCLVHNGIIENDLPLKRELTARGVSFLSETDSEVLVRLLDSLYDGDPLATLRRGLARVRGSYALAVLFSDHPDRIYAVRRESPLIVGCGDGENFVASDMPALLKYTRRFCFPEEDEIAVLTRENVRFFAKNGVEIFKEPKTVDWDMSAAEKNGYPHFMLKEIHEQPEALRRTVRPRLLDGLPDFSKEGLDDRFFAGIRRIRIVGCGTAYHAGMVGKDIFTKLAQLDARAEIASEFRYSDPLLEKGDLVLLISQSGETLDTLAALRLAKAKGCPTLALVNVAGSSIARDADHVLYTFAGPEIAVASTKAYSVQLALLYLLAFRLALARGATKEDEIRALTARLAALPEQLQKFLARQEEFKALAGHFKKAETLFYLGRGLDYALSLEGSLKLKEISYIHSEAYPSGELKHGTISLIVKDTPVIALATQDALYEKTLSNVKETRARGAKVLLLCKESFVPEAGTADYTVTLPDDDDRLMPFLLIVPLQLFAYYMSVLRGCDVDKPRNLAKSVTVE